MTTSDHTDASIDDQVAMLMTGSEFGDLQLQQSMGDRLRTRLGEAEAERRPLRVYAGYDPSAPDLHLGHSITLRKLRQFQRLGHDVTVVIGTVTATIGDTSDRATGRPRKSAAEVQEAANTYAAQVFSILDANRTAVVANGDWLNEMRLPEILDLASHFTVQQFLARDNYKRRLSQGEPMGLHEFFYALLQGYDAVHLRADVQLGATEQLFNILAGAKLQEAFGQKPCVALTFPILVGLDGVDRMSKSQGNYVGLTEPPVEQFGKVMSVSDETMLQWVVLISDWSPNEIDSFRQALSAGELHPMEAKKRLARQIVEMRPADLGSPCTTARRRRRWPCSTLSGSTNSDTSRKRFGKSSWFSRSRSSSCSWRLALHHPGRRHADSLPAVECQSTESELIRPTALSQGPQPSRSDPAGSFGSSRSRRAQRHQSVTISVAEVGNLQLTKQHSGSRSSETEPSARRRSARHGRRPAAWLLGQIWGALSYDLGREP